ncbi:MAG: hypothetical protein ACKVS5_07310 [Parvularculaceae bacterium]
MLKQISAIAALSAAIAMSTSAYAAQKVSKDECTSLWSQASGGASGDVAMNKASAYVSDFKKADANGDSKLSSSEWTAACNQGLVRSAEAPSSGANSGASTGEGGKTSDRTPESNPERTPGASSTGAAGTEQGQTPSGTSDRTPAK